MKVWTYFWAVIRIQHVLQELTPAHPFKPPSEPPLALH